MDKLITYINRIVVLKEEDIALIKRCAREESYEKNAMILKPGQFCDRIWYISSGMVRKFYLDDGDEVTLWVHCEGEIISSLNSYFHEQATTEYLQACETTQLISISKENSRILAESPAIMEFTNRMMGEQFARLDVNSREFMRLDAREKYEFLRKLSPEMIKRAKLGHIASIMGVHPSTLSRLRKTP